MDLVEIANKTIPASNANEVLINSAGVTSDIMTQVRATSEKSQGQLKKFAPHLKGDTLRQTLYNVWRFWKSNIKYQPDPKGTQLVKQPKALWKLKKGDCKSLSVAVVSTLQSLGINAAFRFTSYGSNSEFPTHVYVVVNDGGNIIPVDCVWTKFGEEKPFTKNWDYNMPTKIYEVSGVQDTELKPMPGNAAVLSAKKHLHKCKCKMPKRCVLVLPDHDITQDQLLILLKKQGIEIEHRNYLQKKGIGAIGSSEDMAYEIQITGMHNAAAEFMKWPRKKLVGLKKPMGLHKREHAICGTDGSNLILTNGDGTAIGYDALQAQAAADKIEGFFGSLWKGIKNVGKAIGKGTKAVGKAVVKGAKVAGKANVKAVKAPINFAKKILTGPQRAQVQNDLPSIAPLFLYTFITDPRILAKLPPIVATKRNKALEYVAKLTGGLQIAKPVFDQAVRNGIMLRFNDTPENVIASWIKQTGYQIGELDWDKIFSHAKAAFGVVSNVLQRGSSPISETLTADAERYMPAIEDWGMLTPEAQQQMAQQLQSPAPYTTQQLYSDINSGQYQQQQYYPTYSNPYPQQYDFSGGGSSGDDYGRTGGGADYPDAGSMLANEKTMKEVIVNNSGRDNNSGGGNGGLLIAGAFGLLLLASKSKKSK